MKTATILLGLLCAGTAHAAGDREASIANLQRQIQSLEKQKQDKVEELKRLGGSMPKPGQAIEQPGLSPEEKAKEAEKKGGDKKSDQKDKLPLIVAKSLTDKNNADLPATFQYSHQRGGSSKKDSKSADFGVSLDLTRYLMEKDPAPDSPWRSVKIGASAEYHYNSGSTPKQDSFLSGADVTDIQLGSIGNLSNYLDAHLKYKSDRILAGQGFQSSLAYRPVDADYALFLRQPLFGGIHYEIRPELGFEVETGDGELSAFHDGDRESFKASLGLVLSTLDQRLQFNNSITYWNHLGTSGGYDLFHSEQTYFQSSLLYYINPEKNFAVGVDYLHGDNPTEGRFNVDEIDLAFKVKY